MAVPMADCWRIAVLALRAKLEALPPNLRGIFGKMKWAF